MEHNNSLSPRVAFVSGSARRIGAEIAQNLHKNGCDLILHYHRSEQEAQNLKTQLEKKRKNSVFLLCADFNKQQDFNKIANTVKNFKNRLDVLINNASVFYPTPLGKINLNDWHNIINSNLKTPLFLTQALIPLLKKTSGSIINIADIHGDRPLKNHCVYSIAKAGVIMMTKSLALELAPNIRVNAIAPGAILWPENEQHDENILSKVPLEKLGSTQDICNAVLYLIQSANYTTGQVLTIDGGRTLTNQ